MSVAFFPPRILRRPRLYLLRHAETTWNVEGRYQGRSDSPLTEHGLRQAGLLATCFASLRGCILISSPLDRALATAHVVGASLCCTPAIDSRLAELAYGAWEGLTQADVAATSPDALRRWKRHPHRMQFPGGESLIDVRRRVDAFLSEASESLSPVVAVTHGAVMRVAILACSGRPLASYRDVRVPNASVTMFVPGTNLVTGFGRPASLDRRLSSVPRWKLARAPFRAKIP